jgi:lipid A 3-O-deacylase
LKRPGVALLLAFAAPIAAAADARWYTQIDNDVAFGTDRWYSSGVRIARVDERIEWGLVHEVYTPEAKHWQPGTIDRAPVGRLLASAALHDRGPGYFQTLELDAGVRGPAALGRQLTEAIHRLIPGPQVDWSRQLENRLDVDLAAVRSQSLGTDHVKVHVGAVLGRDVTFAHAGAELRFGVDPAASSQLLRYAATPPWSDGAPAAGFGGLGVMVGAGARAVLRNALLERNYDPFGPPLSRRRTVRRLVGGIHWTQPWGALSFEMAQDSREFDAQRTPHKFGSLSIHVAF